MTIRLRLSSHLHLYALCFALVVPGLVVPAMAAPREKTKRRNPIQFLQDAYINKQIDRVAAQVGKRYDLTPDQSKVAREMLETNCRNFIDNNFDKLVPLFTDWMEIRRKENSSAKQVQDWAKNFHPLYKQATDLIISENQKFSKILTKKQKKIHARDVRRMQRQFGRTTLRLKRWRKGGFRPEDFGRHPAVKPEDPDPTKPDTWVMAVKIFIEAYQLDKSQQTMAWSVHADRKPQALAYLQDYWVELAEARAAVEQLSRAEATQPAERKTSEALRARLDQLEKPLREIFEQLMADLIMLPTEEQIKAGERALAAAAGEGKDEPATKPKGEIKATTATQKAQQK